MKSLVDRIINYKTYTKRRKLDTLLELDADIWCNQGSDSTKKEIEEARKMSRIIYRGIKEIDSEMGTQFLRTQDTKDGLIRRDGSET